MLESAVEALKLNKILLAIFCARIALNVDLGV
jgi:hypothetical protein